MSGAEKEGWRNSLKTKHRIQTFKWMTWSIKKTSWAKLQDYECGIQSVNEENVGAWTTGVLPSPLSENIERMYLMQISVVCFSTYYQKKHILSMVKAVMGAKGEKIELLCCSIPDAYRLRSTHWQPTRQHIGAEWSYLRQRLPAQVDTSPKKTHVSRKPWCWKHRIS
jgi:hypothetical protein